MCQGRTARRASKWNRVNIPEPGLPNRDVAVDGDVTESGDAGGGPGKSSLFFLTARPP